MSNNDDSLDDLIGDGEATVTASKKSVAKKAVAAPPAKKATKAAPAATRARGIRGQGKFHIDPDERAALFKKMSVLTKPITTKEAAEKYGCETFKARRTFVALEAEGKGSTSKIGATVTYTPSR